MAKNGTANRAKLVLAVAFPGVQMLDLIGPLEIFCGANKLLQRAIPAVPDHYWIQVAGHTGQPVNASNGMAIHVHRSLSWIPQAVDTLVIPGALEIEGALADSQIIRWIRRIAPRCRRVASVCSGTFLLAEAGLLHNRNVTTHWAGSDSLKKRYPFVQVEPDRIFIRDGSIYTSAGVTAGMDLALALVEEDLGRQMALDLARWFVMFLKRPGDQSQFSMHLRAQYSDSPRIQKLLSWIAENPASDLSVKALAQRMNLSPRHFVRVFFKQVGVTPATHVLETRLEQARCHLESSHHGLKSIATKAGFGSEESLRRVFQKRLGVTPGEYRKRCQRT